MYSTDEFTDDDLEFLLSESMGENRTIPVVSSPIPTLQGSFPSTSAAHSQPIQSPPGSVSSQIPPPPFSTPPILKLVQDVMNDRPGTDVQRLRELAIALAKDAIIGKKELIICSLSGRKHTATLNSEKLGYIKMAVHSTVPHKSPVEFEHIWALCRSSISKSCQTLRTLAWRKL